MSAQLQRVVSSETAAQRHAQSIKAKSWLKSGRRHSSSFAQHVALLRRPGATAISHKSALAENANLHEQNRRLARQVADLEERLSELLSQQAFDRSSLGAPANAAALQAELEAERQVALDLRQMPEERDDELAAAARSTAG